MESGQRRDQPAQGTPQGPQSPAGPQSPSPGPQAPAPGPQAPAPESPAASPQSPGYSGPVPPGGWAQPVAAPQQSMVAPGELASWGTRLGAYLLDILILLVPTIIIVAIVVGAAVGSDAAGIVTGIVGFLVYIVVLMLYAPMLMKREGVNNGQTWGKQIVGIRAVRDNGQAFTFGSAALREIVLKGLAVSIASSIIPIIPWFLNYFWPLWDDQNRALHDMAVSTHVVRA